MAFEDITADLPPPGDDEPASLRQDIFDELADHLACAMARETQSEQVVRQDPCSTAWSRVVARFGSPRAVMFQLWREAMWETLMMQRVVSWMMIVTMGVMCLGMLWIVRSMNEQQRAVLAQQREMAATLERINEQSRRPLPEDKGNASIEWNSVEIALSSEVQETVVPPGYTVHLSQLSSVASLPPWVAKTAEDPTVRFPHVRYGRYTVVVVAPWGERSIREVDVNPGTPLRQTIICPTTPLESLAVMPQLVLPEDLQKRSLHVTFALDHGIRTVGGSQWQSTSRDAPEPDVVRRCTLRLGADGRLRPETIQDSLETFLAYDASGKLQGIRWIDREVQPVHCFFQVERDVRDHDLPSPQPDGAPDEPKTVRLFFLFQESFKPGRDFRFDISQADRRLRIELTEVGVLKLRRALSRFDATENDDELTLHFSGNGYPSKLLEPFPEQLR